MIRIAVVVLSVTVVWQLRDNPISLRDGRSSSIVTPLG
ncbi:hypothetical protein FAGKG844_70101 [Frankia sp. AgKG'84/4]